MPSPVPSERNILFVDAGPFFGGAQRSLLQLMLAVRKQSRFRPVIALADRSPGGLLAQCEEHHIPATVLPVRPWRRSPRGGMQFLADRFRQRSALHGFFEHHRPRLVHANSVRAGLLACPSSHPLIVHDRDRRAPAAARLLLTACADAIVAVSESVAACWPQAARRQKIRVIANGFDLLRIRNAAAGVEKSAEGLSIGLVADLVPWKRHDLFLRTLHLAKTRIPGLRATVVGRPLQPESGVYLRSLRELADELGLSERVTFVTDCQDAVPWIASLDVLMSTSDREPFGRSVVEALAIGVPVVAVRGGGPEEILSGTGAGTVTDATPSALAEALQTWEAPDRRRAAATQARQRAEAFDIRRSASQIIDLYETLT